MVVHRDYRDSSGSVIKIYDDRIEFYNPGKLFGGITVEDLLSGNYTSKSRNKLIAKAFKEIGLIERYGSGIYRIQEICKNYGVVTPVFEEIADGFRVVLFNEKLDVIKQDKGNEGLKILLELIQKNEGIQGKDIAEELDRPIKTIERQIAELIKRELIERRGSRKTGGYFVIDK